MIRSGEPKSYIAMLISLALVVGMLLILFGIGHTIECMDWSVLVNEPKESEVEQSATDVQSFCMAKPVSVEEFNSILRDGYEYDFLLSSDARYATGQDSKCFRIKQEPSWKR